MELECKDEEGLGKRTSWPRHLGNDWKRPRRLREWQWCPSSGRVS